GTCSRVHVDRQSCYTSTSLLRSLCHADDSVTWGRGFKKLTIKPLRISSSQTVLPGQEPWNMTHTHCSQDVHRVSQFLVLCH
ncbi:hypothetical protein ScPMuIL_007332, partial [Solemya velum]